MSRDTGRNLLLIALLCAGGWGLMQLFSRWEAKAPQRTNAATQVLGSPYVGDEDTMYFHRRRCPQVTAESGRGAFAKKKLPEHFIGFDTRDRAIEAGFVPCEECKP